MKKIICIFIILLLITTTIPFIGQADYIGDDKNGINNNIDTGSITVTLRSKPYTITINEDEISEIIMEDFGSILIPGYPKLPSRTFNIGLPPKAEVISVELIDINQVVRPGIYDIKTSNFYSNNMKIQKFQKKNEIYNLENAFPTNVYEFLGKSQYNEFNLAQIRFNPFSYNPVKGILTLTEDIKLKIEYKLSKDKSNLIYLDEKYIDIASSFIENYESISHYYISKPSNNQMATYDYVIITTEELEDSVYFLKNWKESIGFDVKVVTTSWISSQYSGSDLEEKIRNFLINKYNSWNIEYVLILGSVSSIPMRYCYPDKNNHGSSGKVPTDYYYADLTGNWDKDGDGFYGERDDDNPDFIAEVWVGRIPIDDPLEIEDICLKIIYFEQNDNSWKKDVLSCGAILNFANEEYSGYQKTDSAELLNELWYDIYSPNGFDRVSMFEKEGLSPCPYSCDYELNLENVVTVWPQGFGIVNIDGHGNSNGVTRKIWSHDDGDNVPEGFEIDWEDFFRSFDCSVLDDSYPGIVFSTGCSVGSPHSSDYLGVSLVRNGAVAFIGASGTSWYTVGWDDKSDGGNQAIDYYFFKYLISNDQSCGKALYNSKLYYKNNFDWWGWHIYQNMFIFNLYGDPSLSFDTYSSGSPPSKPTKPSGIEEGRPMISYTYSTSSIDPDNDNIIYKWDWGDGNISDWMGPFESGEEINIDHVWITVGEFEVKVLAVDEIGRKSEWSDSLMVNIVNHPPNKPTVNGPTEFGAKKIITFTSSTTDIDDDEIYYMFSWGDGQLTDWLGPFDSGYEISEDHSWEYQGHYYVKVKTKDEFDSESEWSDELSITVPRSKTVFSHPFNGLLSRFTNLFPIFRILLIGLK